MTGDRTVYIEVASDEYYIVRYVVGGGRVRDEADGGLRVDMTGLAHSMPRA